MTKIRETVDIDAPALRVWAVVQEDARNAPKWSSNMAKVEQLDRGKPGVGTRYRYYLNLPGGFRETLEVEQTAYHKPKKCVGKFTDGPLKGTWSYTYTERSGKTHLVYEMDFQLGGLMRLAGSLLAREYANGIRHNMAALKKYIESGRGPQGTRSRSKASG